MRLLVTTEARLCRARDGGIYSDSLYGRAFFDRYLTVFDEVAVLARVTDSALPRAPAAAALVEDARVRVVALPDYRGAVGLARSWRAVDLVAREAVRDADAVMLRAPGHVSSAVHAALSRSSSAAPAYGVEVVGDPAEVFRSGASRHRLRPLIRAWTTRSLRRLCAGASAVGYVSAVALPERYPATNARLTTTYSSVTLPPDAFAPRLDGRAKEVREFVTVASMEQPYKGVDVLLRALSTLESGSRLTVVGDGRLRPGLHRLAEELGLADRVTFTGNLPGQAAVRAVIERSDAFVLASRTEGLPRAMLEAMAAGLPCVGTDVGGIPELLPHDAMCPPGDVPALAALMRRLERDTAFVESLRSTLAARALEYTPERLQARRDEVLRVLRSGAAA